MSPFAKLPCSIPHSRPPLDTSFDIYALIIVSSILNFSSAATA